MNIAALIAVAIRIAEIFGGTSKFAATIKALLTALQNSPALLEWLTTILTKPVPAGVPGTALPLTDDLTKDATLKAAFDASPEMQAACAPANTPEGTQAFGLGGLLTLITYLPTIIALLKALAAGNFGKVE